VRGFFTFATLGFAMRAFLTFAAFATGALEQVRRLCPVFPQLPHARIYNTPKLKMGSGIASLIYPTIIPQAASAVKKIKTASIEHRSCLFFKVF